MPQRRPRRAPPSSRLTTAGRVAIAVVLAGMVLLRTGWGRLGRDGDGPWLPWQRIAAPGGATPGALPGATATAQDDIATPRWAAPTRPGEPTARASSPATPLGDGDPAPPGAAAPGPDDRPLAAVVVGGVVAEGGLRRDPDLGLDVPTVTLRASDGPAHALAWARLDARAGRDVTGDGRPDLVLERDTGGMGCCWALWVYEVAAGAVEAEGAVGDGGDVGAGGAGGGTSGSRAVDEVDAGDASDAADAVDDIGRDLGAGPSLVAADEGADAWLSEAGADGLGLRPVLGLPLSRCRGRFDDLDGDGAPEVVTCDPTVPSALCSAYDGGDPTVVLRYEVGVGFVPATADVAATADGRTRLDAGAGDDGGGGAVGGDGAAGDGLCAVLPAALADLYRGRDDDAWARLAGLDDAAAVRRRIAALAADSPLYRAPGAAGRPVIDNGDG